ncbi:MAG: helix-turn-helix transcriptional regulator [Verrucomicrobia bacterium]|nr:helix-turn-helix transcriptional regulator [Verrucomicrobiota bacterium]
MPRLGHLELRAFSEALLELYSPGPNTDLPARMFTTLHRCLSFDFLGYHEITDNRNQRGVIYPEYPFHKGIFEAYLHQHPAWNAIIRARLEASVKISDFVSRDRWQRTDLYNHIFRPRGLNHQLAFITFGEFSQLGVALNRSTRDFSEEERSLLDLFKPHLSQALTASKLFSYYSDAAEGNGQAWIVADSAGRILFETGKAIDLLREFFGQNGSLPPQLRDWLKRRAQSLVNSNCLNLTLKEFSVQRGAKRLDVQSLSPVNASEHRLVLRETSEALDARSLQTLGLTKREAEVLLWISQGKRNCEIAEILGARSRTIGKHVERILGKLCVETRTAAANIAAEVLHLR